MEETMRKYILILILSMITATGASAQSLCNIGTDPENLSRQPTEGEERYVLTSDIVMTVGSRSGKRTTCRMPRGTGTWINSKSRQIVWVENCGNTVHSTHVIEAKRTPVTVVPTCDDQCKAIRVSEACPGLGGMWTGENQITCNKPATVEVRRPQADVQPVDIAGVVLPLMGVPTLILPAPRQHLGTTCESSCPTRPAATKVTEVKSEFCGIRTDKGDVLALLDKGDRLQVAKNPTFGRNPAGNLVVISAEHDMVFNGVTTSQFKKNCDNVQQAVETTMWTSVVHNLRLETSCKPLNRLAPSNNRFGSV
jgi:hypothetical protein